MGDMADYYGGDGGFPDEDEMEERRLATLRDKLSREMVLLASEALALSVAEPALNRVEACLRSVSKARKALKDASESYR